MPRKNKIFDDIMSGLDEILDWTKGNGKLRVTLPGQKPRLMTREQYEAEKAKLNARA